MPFVKIGVGCVSFSFSSEEETRDLVFFHFLPASPFFGMGVQDSFT
jgi:hypothetical protein